MQIQNYLFRKRYLKAVLVIAIAGTWLTTAQAFDCILDADGDGIGDGTAEANSENNQFRIACGYSASAAGQGSVSLGADSGADGNSSTAIGAGARANGETSISIGSLSSAPGAASVVLGSNARASGNPSIAVGAFAKATRPGAIAIGSGASANNVNTIVLGGGTTSVAANTVVSGYPLLVKQPNSLAATRNLLTIRNVGPAGFRFEDAATNDAWLFRQTIDRGFTMDALNTPGQQEFKFFEGGNMKILGTLTQGSSRENKKQIQSVNSIHVLDQLSELPIHQWTYKHEQNKVKHIGPMAEDFYKIFKIGVSPKGISALDTSGVALAAIKALKEENTILNNEIEMIKAQLVNVNEIKLRLDQIISLNSKSNHLVAQ